MPVAIGGWWSSDECERGALKLLGFDTATSATAVAVLDCATGAVHERRDDPPAGSRPRHTTRLLALIDAVLADAGADWDAIDRIAVGTGPGTFTGLRIGIATAHALARARGTQLVGVSTLRALALSAAGEASAGEHAVGGLIDARRGELFAAAWTIDEVAAAEREPLLAQREPLLGPAAFVPDELLAQLRALGPGLLCAGDGAVAWASELGEAGVAVASENRVSAAALCRLAARTTDLPASPDAVAPEYLRAPDAKLRDQAVARA